MSRVRHRHGLRWMLFSKKMVILLIASSKKDNMELLRSMVNHRILLVVIYIPAEQISRAAMRAARWSSKAQSHGIGE